MLINKLRIRNNEFFAIILLWIAIGTLGRLIPHIPNATPFTSLCLLAGALFPRKLAISLTLVIASLSNLLLSYFYGYAAFGWWSLFTYTGFIAMILVGTQLSSEAKFIKTIIYALGSSFGFWLWTNFGTWLLSGMYAKSLIGFVTCYIAGLPFLRYALLGTVTWMVILLGSIHIIRWTTQRPWQYLSKDIVI